MKWLIFNKSHLRFIAVFLAVAICFGVVCIAAQSGSYSIISAGGNESISEVFDAMSDFSTSNQAGGVWKYCYSKDFENPQWQQLNRYSGDGYWYTDKAEFDNQIGMSSSGRLRITNEKGLLPVDERVSLCWAFDVSENGTVNISSNNAAKYGGWPEGYSGMVRITKNGENIYPQSGWLDVDIKEKDENGNDKPDVVYFDDISFSAAAGDIIRFEYTSNKILESGIGPLHLTWNPAFVFVKDEGRYSNDNGILGGLSRFMHSFFSSYSVDGSMTNTDELSSAIKGADNSKYGVYSAYDSVYSSGSAVIPSSHSSVWKYAVLKQTALPFNNKVDKSINVSAKKSGLKIEINWYAFIKNGVYGITVNNGADITDYYTVSAASGSNGIILPVFPENEIRLVQIHSGNISSHIIKLWFENGTLKTEKLAADYGEGRVVHLDEQSVENKNKKNAAVNIFDTESASEYKFFTSMVTDNTVLVSEAQCPRRIIFSAAENEAMMFGFTAPFGGEYDFTAPISCENSAIGYTVIKELLSGDKQIIQTEKTTQNSFESISLNVELEAGETVWLKAEGSAPCVINIGVPTAVLKGKLSHAVSEVRVYKYRAVDYFENASASSRKYGNYSTVDKTAKVWSFGYYDNPVSVSGELSDFDNLGLLSLAEGDSAEALIGALKPYELIRSGVIYNSLKISEKADGKVQTGDLGLAGVMSLSLGSNHADRYKRGLPYKSKGIFATVGYGTNIDKSASYNIGVFMQYKAPVSGNAMLKFNENTDSARIADRLIVLKNNEVYKIYNKSLESKTELYLGNINVGDRITLCYSKLDGGSMYGYIGAPIMEVSGSWKNVSFENSKGGSVVITASSVQEIELPVIKEKLGYKAIGWRSDKTNELAVGSATIGENTVYSAEYVLYGDINADGSIDALDISGISKCVLGSQNAQYGNDDVNADGSTDILDIVRMKKWIAGVPAVLGK